MSEENEASYLKPTFKKLGELIPVFRSPDGEVIDGKHRLEVNPEWHSHIITVLDDPVKKAMARLVVNVVRRKVPAEEKTELLGQIAKLTKWTPQEIADAIGMSYEWVTKYLPDEFKRQYTKESLHRKDIQEGVKKVNLLQQHPERVNCEHCHVGVFYPHEWTDKKGKTHMLCSVCIEKAERGEFDEKLNNHKPKLTEEEEQKVNHMVEIYAPIVKEVAKSIPEPDPHNPERNRMVLNMVLKNLLEGILFCPLCGHTMLECSECHITLEQMKEKEKL